MCNSRFKLSCGVGEETNDQQTGCQWGMSIERSFECLQRLWGIEDILSIGFKEVMWKDVRVWDREIFRRVALTTARD